MIRSGLLVGGVGRAVRLGLGTVMMRASLGAGASMPLYLAVVGRVVALIGRAAFIWKGAQFSLSGQCCSLSGEVW